MAADSLALLERFHPECAKYFDVHNAEPQTLAKQVLEHSAKGILLSSNSIAASIALNKIENIRAAISYNQYMAAMCREHNDANILIVPLDVVAAELALHFVKDFACTEFDIKTTPNHQRRVNKLKLSKLI